MAPGRAPCNWLRRVLVAVAVARAAGSGAEPGIEPEACQMSDAHVVVIDISPYVDKEAHTDEARKKIAALWGTSFSTLGMVLIDGHGVPDDLVASLRAEAFAFFGKAPEEKAKFTFGPYGTPMGGYTPMGVEAVARSVEGVSSAPDLVENFAFRWESGRGMQPAVKAGGWQKLPFPSAETYVDEMERVLRTLHEISADALSLPSRSFFEPFYAQPNGNALRLAHYPRVGAEANREAGQIRYGAHSDYQGFTILSPDPGDGGAAGGLQVQDPNTKLWVPVPPVKSTFAVNVGDLWERWTNDRWTSSVHRVTNPTGAGERGARLSLVYFSGPRADALIEPLPGLGESIYPPILAGDHLVQKLTRTNV